MKYIQKFKTKENHNVFYYPNGNKKVEYYTDSNGKIHKDDKPAFSDWFEDGKKQTETYYTHGEINRKNGPAQITWYPNGDIESISYFTNGKFDRKDGPARIVWSINGNKSSEIYFKNGFAHREDGPAYNDYKEWKENVQIKKYFLNGIHYDRKKWIEELKKINSPHYKDELLKYEAEAYNI